jgi:hypothetical protein
MKKKELKSLGIAFYKGIHLREDSQSRDQNKTSVENLDDEKNHSLRLRD